MRQIDEVIIHCSATKPGWLFGATTTEKVAEIRRWHTDPRPIGRGWSDIGYHYLIDREGTVARGRPVERVGAHVKGHNTGTIGVCLIGAHGAAATDSFEDHFTQDQREAMHRLVKNLQDRFGALKISGHNEYANKGCPGFQVATEFSGPVRDAEHIHHDEAPAQGFLAALVAAILSLFGGRK